MRAFLPSFVDITDDFDEDTWIKAIGLLSEIPHISSNFNFNNKKAILCGQTFVLWGIFIPLMRI